MSLASRLDPWLPPVALMGVIYALSAQPNLDSGLGLIDTVGRKLLHAGEYALLCYLWFRALRTRMTIGPALGAAFTLSLVYAGTDEYHQTFVAGRAGSPIDLAIDGLGAAVAVAILRRRERPGRGRPTGAAATRS